MTPKKKRFYILFSAFSFFCFIVGVILIVLQDNILFFYTPSEILQKNLKQNEKVRLGGLVEENSVVRNDIKINFTITDLKKNIEVSYEGILPDLFREGQGEVLLCTDAAAEGLNFQFCGALLNYCRYSGMRT